MSKKTSGRLDDRVFVRDSKDILPRVETFENLQAFVAAGRWRFREILIDQVAVAKLRERYVAEAMWGPSPRARHSICYLDGSNVPLDRLLRAADGVGIRLPDPDFVWACNKRPHAFREGPVPRTGRRGHYSWDRHMRTTQERREDRALLVDEDAKQAGVGPRRRRLSIPHAWDDVPRFSERTWKRHRLTSWKAL